MTGNLETAVAALNRRFLVDHPIDAARLVESMGADDAAATLAGQDVGILLPVWRRILPGDGTRIMLELPQETTLALLSEMLPNEALQFLNLMEDADRVRFLAALTPQIGDEISKLMRYPETSAGRLMNPMVQTFRSTMTAWEALQKLRAAGIHRAQSLFIVDDDTRMRSRVFIQDMAIAEDDTPLAELERPVTEYVNAMASVDEVQELLEKDRNADLPVIDTDGKLIGVISHAAMVQSIQEDATADIQTMVGASKDERALSAPMFAVRKRLPWLQINLLTAFMAAAVVGLFENTIAQFTALAVLLPVVAGQSGNAGAQALAVTMRGLALREISIRQWPRVTLKEVNVGLVNGLAVAVTCGLGVYFWSGSFGLVVVIAISMVLAMVAAGFAGAIVPIVLTRLGQDPAQSSSIVLTTVTDIAGFFSFLGIATLLSGML
ncbi:MAG: magnesium transporter [Rhodospirillales bacterium]|nr:magnesium transporter [Rhodospirillales bacterium]